MKKILLSLVFISIFGLLGYGQATVTTNDASNVSYTSAQLNGYIDPNGGSCYSVEFEYATNSSFSGSSTVTPDQGSTINSAQSITYTLTGLSTSTTYYFRLKVGYSTADGGGVTGNTKNFTTSAPTTPTVTISSSITSITKTAADCNSNSIDDDGGATVTENGICWSTTNPPTTSDNKDAAGTAGATPYDSDMKSLSAGTKYYVRAYAINSQGTGYSSTTRNFITDTEDPTIANESNIEATSFSANWNSVTGAQGYYLDVATDTGFTSFVSGYNNKDVGNVTTYSVTGLSATTDYYYRVRAYHDGGDDGADFTSGNSASNKVTTVASEPSTQASGIKYETISGNMHITWTDGNGANRIVIMREGSPCQDPVSGETYSADAAFGLGDDVPNGSSSTYCVYNSSGAKASDVTVTNLSSGKDYYFEVLEYNGTGSSTNYNTTTSTGWNSGNSANSQLPITLAEFNAKMSVDGVELDWKTATEINNDYFIIQRSVDGENFEDIEQIRGTGTSNVLTSYSFIDKNAPEGIVYYRLKQVDFDGTSALSTVIYIDTKDNAGEVNITKVISKENSLDIYINKTTNTSAVMNLYDMNGKLIQGVILGHKGGRVIKFNMSNYSHGIYFIKIQTGDKTVSKKVVY